MASGATSRLKTPYPVPTDAFNAATDMQSMVSAALDQSVPYYQQSSAPTPSGSPQGAVSGQLWWCTNASSTSHGLNYWDGTAWNHIGGGSSSGGGWTVFTTSPATMAAGAFYLVTGAHTMATPTNTSGVEVGVMSADGGPLTINASTGTIIGAGIPSGATSITLGTPGTYVVLLATGSDWIIASGQADTGWSTSLTYSTVGPSYIIGAAPPDTPSFRRVGSLVKWRGQVSVNASWTGGTALTIGGNNSPSTTVSVGLSHGSAVQNLVDVSLSTMGDLNIPSMLSSGGLNLYLDAISYYVD